MTQRIKFKIAVYALLFILACIALAWLINFASLRAQDYQTLSELKQAQAQLTAYYYWHNTFSVSGCQAGSLLSSCKSSQFNSNGLDFKVFSMDDNDFQLGFTLRTPMGGLKPGEHIYGKEGVIK